MTARSYLFVPGDSDKKLAKGAESGADALVLDLEDSVATPRKGVARQMVRDYVVANSKDSPAQLWVRINPLAEGGLDDVVEIVRAGPFGLVVPKVDHPSDLTALSLMLDALERRDGIATPIRLLSVATETARAPFALSAYCDISLPRLHGLTWGAEDLSAALGARTNRDPVGKWAFTYAMVRSGCLLAARSCGVAPIETLFADYRDEAGLEADCAAASREGFVGRIAIHPAQVAVINAAFSPSAEDVAHAQAVVDAFAASPGTGVVGLNGKMLDIPHLKQAQQILAQADGLARQSGHP